VLCIPIPVAMLVAAANALYAIHMFLMCAVLKNETELIIYEACRTETCSRMLASDVMAINCHMHLDRSPTDAKVCLYLLQSILVLLCKQL
jgi:hypothetical protein